MRVSLAWLEEWVEHGFKLEELCHRLTVAGLEVEQIERQGYLNPLLIVGEIEACSALPQKPAIRIADVKIGHSAHLVILSGAPNLDERAVGRKVAVALDGATIFDAYHATLRTKLVKSGVVYGHTSEGVLCSEKELGLSDDHSGILYLEEHAEVGQPAWNWLQIPEAAFADTVLTIDILPNIARCMSMNGMAREVSALAGSPIKARLDYEDLVFEKSALDPSSSDPHGCDQFYTALIEGIEIKPSPAWMQARLAALGQEPRNNVVDVSNYVMMELGQPTHMYDASTLASLNLGVRPAQVGEHFLPLTSAEHDEPLMLPEGTLVITSDDEPVAAAGIMGGFHSQVTDATTTVLLEAAHFNLISIRKSQTALNIFSEASARFSRGVDPSLPAMASRRIVALLKETCPNLRVVQTGLYSYEEPKTHRIDVSLETMNSALGTALEIDHVANLLKRVGLQLDAQDCQLCIEVPPARQDLRIAADIFEEVARLNGYDDMPATMPSEPVPMHPRNEARAVREKAMSLLVQTGLTEVMNYSLISPERERNLRLNGDTDPAYVRVKNPITKDRIALRRTLLGGILQNVADNLKHTEGCAFFEGASVYWPIQESDQSALPEEPKRLAMALAGIAEPATVHRSEPRFYDFYDLGRIIDELFQGLNIAAPIIRESRSDPYHPGICAEIWSGKVCFGEMGALHPQIKARFDINPEVPVFACEMDLDRLAVASDLCTRVRPLPRFPGIELDLALIVREEIQAQSALDITHAHAGPLLRQVHIFDVYRGPQLPSGHKMLGLRFNFRADQRTLTMEEVNAIRDDLMTRFTQALGATLRD